ncbi:DUF3152 domain-containing protein [Actinomadura atramentaria]|uniref:DUF3152 domain-containing protein n=1 Tax=Actinomadura atramentaria TaxID=1990 RepID=UPI0003A619B1|nr:DUF3152 domain-containing protein [Actinomadura atramentaria]
MRDPRPAPRPHPSRTTLPDAHPTAHPDARPDAGTDAASNAGVNADLGAAPDPGQDPKSDAGPASRRARPGGRAAGRPRRAPGGGPGRVWAAVGAVAVLAAGGTAAALALRPGDAPGPAHARPATAASAEPSTDPSTTSKTPRRGSASRRAAPPGTVVNGRRQPTRVAVPVSAGGRFATAPGTAPARPGAGGPVVRYAVDVERGLPFPAAAFAADVHRVLNDPRSWGAGGRMRFVRVDHGPVRFRVSLASPSFTDRLCAPLVTGGQLSCRAGLRSVINARRWGEGAPTYGRDLATYREYVINHEVGHALGHGHQTCPGAGRRAPVMVQQTKSLYGCRINPWPFPGAAARPPER